MKYISFFLLLGLFRLDACTDRQLRDGRIAEQLYVELLEAIYKPDLAVARLAATDLKIQLDQMNQNWRRPMGKQALEDCRYHLDQGQAAYGDVLAALKSGNLPLARIHLDRATYELAVADQAAFNRLYLGAMYPFFSNWQEVNKIIQDQMLCLMEWTEYAWWANLAVTEWQEAACYGVDARIYPWEEVQKEQFRAAHQALDQAMTTFKATIPAGEQQRSQAAADSVNEALWRLLTTLKSKEKANILLN